MKVIVFIFLFFAVFGLLISDPYLTDNFYNIGQSLFVFPLLVYSLFLKKIALNESLLKYFLIYVSIIVFFFIIDGAKNTSLLINLIGTSLLSISFYNVCFKKQYYKYLFNLFIIGSLIIALAFYFQFWELNNFTGRSSFIKHNENMLGQVLNIGLVLAFYNYFVNLKNRKSIIYLLSVLLFIVPIFATISRTSIAVLILSFSFFIFAYFYGVKRVIFILFIFLFLITQYFLESSIFQKTELSSQFIERTSNSFDDERADLWDIGIRIALDNAFTGIGFSNFNDENWRLQVGLFFGISKPNMEMGYIPASIHNSYIDLFLIGGIYLLLIYLIILLYLFVKSFKLLFSVNVDMRFIGALCLSLTLNVFSFSFTGQGATEKISWFLIGIAYAFLHRINSLRLVEIK
jgi:O-antigen ligase